MKEHLLTIAFLGLLFLLYMAPMPESFLNKDFDSIEEEYLDPQQRQNSDTPNPDTTPQDSIQTSVVAATRL